MIIIKIVKLNKKTISREMSSICSNFNGETNENISKEEKMNKKSNRLNKKIKKIALKICLVT
jgi:hypothetical protein